MARVVLVAPPFAGHLHPVLALGRGLRHRHDVTVVSTFGAREAIEGADLPAQCVLAGADAAVEAIANPPTAVRSNPILLNRSLRANIALMGAFRDEFAAVCTKLQPDLVIAESVVPVAGLVAERFGISWWTLMTGAPSVLENRTAPTSYLGGWSPMPAPFGPIRDRLGWTLISGFKHAVFRLYRNSLRDLGFPSLYRRDGSEVVYSAERIFMSSVRELEFARRWPRNVTFAGPLLYSPPTIAPIPSPPERSGRKRVFVTMGRQIPWFKERALEAVRETARLLPEVEFRCSLGDRGAGTARAEDNVAVLAYADYPREIALSDLVIHHAGAGITNECLRQGVPSLVHPVDYDQFDTAARLCAAGVAHRARSLRRLPSAVSAAVEAGDLRARSAAFAKVVARYDAVALIGEAIEERLSNGSHEPARSAAPDVRDEVSRASLTSRDTAWCRRERQSS